MNQEIQNKFIVEPFKADLIMERKSCKIIHVHFLTTHKNFYFGSVAAIFKKFSEEEIGYSKEYISHALVEDGNHLLSKKVLIIRSRLIR